MKVAVRPFGEDAVLIDWAAKIDENMHAEIVAVNAFINNTCTEVLIETVTTYHSIAVFLKESIHRSQFILDLQELLNKDFEKVNSGARIVTIPVCYEDCYALDIAAVGASRNLSTGEVIKLHTAPIYLVYFLGFLPGFPYLGGLDKKLHTPRRNTPRIEITAGSIGIGGTQTGIYPSNSPGGWNIIGKTPVNLFDVAANQPNLLKAGDHLKFESISLTEFEQIEKEIKSGTFQFKTTVL